MTIKQQGGVFGRNPSFNDVEAEQVTTSSANIADLVVSNSSSFKGNMALRNSAGTQVAFEAEGLDSWAYGLLCHDFWVEADVTIPAEYKSVVATPAEFDEEGNEVTPAVYEEVEETPERIERQTFATLADVPEGAANVVEHDRMGVRYDELFAFILAAL